ncbi:GDNF family receptor alpha-like isoform X2 [Triplophysa rosa]|uniref:GDNF family receptor alpha-like isoform X2 n=1 Tax=Triplophysa rosa TaxID=992332 RepID=UPI0025461105|nr:GDNF family receptor alpha-like isoform X2 [Triplophysa rosa]
MLNTDMQLTRHSYSMRAIKAALIVSCLLCQVVRTSTACTSHMGACVSPRFCKNEQDGSGQLTDPKLCNNTLQMTLTRSPALGECLCYSSDPCSTLQQMCSQCQHHSAQENKKHDAEWQTGGQIDHRINRSCLEEIMACIEDEMCNRKMVPFVQACSAYHCKSLQCRQAMGHFYSTLPHSRAETMVFCECDREDQECQQMKDSLHSGSCVTDESQTPWTCLEMLDSCSGDVLCRQIFNSYLSDCFGAEKAPLDHQYSASDWLQLLDPDFFLGEQQQCRVAFVATMGSVLHHPCICDRLHHQDLHKCTRLQQLFQNKSLFKLSRTKETLRHKLSDEINVGPQPTNESSSEQQLTNELSTKLLSDQLLYLLIYISVLMVVVMFAVSLVLHRLRRLHQAAGKQQGFEAHQSKSLMLVSDNI